MHLRSLLNWGAVSGFDGDRVVDVNYDSLATLDHMRSAPVDGTWLGSAETGIVYRVAGGAALRLYNHGALPGFSGANVVKVNQVTVDNRDHLLATPRTPPYSRASLREAGGRFPADIEWRRGQDRLPWASMIRR